MFLTKTTVIYCNLVNIYIFVGQQAMVMLRLWLSTEGNKASGNVLEKALRRIDREDIVNKCIINVEVVNDDMERAAAKAALASDQEAFDAFKVVWIFTVLFIDLFK